MTENEGSRREEAADESFKAGEAEGNVSELREVVSPPESDWNCRRLIRRCT